ncbi:MAG: hypothetical protein Q7T20_07165 [Saprospiraceae bacterium]|nr:hypothetical protein [Saprospiraceae bacterium]
MKQVTAFWYINKSAIQFTLKSWGLILIVGILFLGLLETFLKRDLPSDFFATALFLSIWTSAPFVLIFGIVTVVFNQTGMMYHEKKRSLCVIGILLGFILIEIVATNTNIFIYSFGYLFTIPISIFYFKL